MKTPRAFISYAWDDSLLTARVRQLALRLRADGVDARLDVWETRLGDSLSHFMEAQVRDSDFVLVLCTPKYKAKSNSRDGGVGYEGNVMTGELTTGSSPQKFIPILYSGQWKDAAPSWLMGSFRVDLSADPIDESAYLKLLATLMGRCEQAPPVGLLSKASTSSLREGRNPELNLVVGMDGNFVGGTDAVRRIAHPLLKGTWDGSFGLRCEAVESIQRELDVIEALQAYSVEQGVRVENLRSCLAQGRTNMEKVVIALRSTFTPMTSRERTWGAHMHLEDATVFIECLFAHGGLAARSGGEWTKCMIYYPKFGPDDCFATFSLPESQRRLAVDEWAKALQCDSRLTSRWTDLLPVLAFHNAPIARYLLPALVFELIRTTHFEANPSAEEIWRRLSAAHPAHSDRDPLNPFDWCVAIKPGIERLDVRDKSSTPPRSKEELEEFVRQARRGGNA